jgi:hypothetical protein
MRLLLFKNIFLVVTLVLVLVLATVQLLLLEE